MTQRTIILKQVESVEHRSQGNKLGDLEEGDTFGGFKAISVEEEECEHPKRQWSLDKKRSSSAPEITGRCMICGHKTQAKPDVE